MTDKGKDKDKGSKYLNRVNDALELAEEDRKRKLFSQRLDIARAGMAAYRGKRIKEALEKYHAYLGLLEEVKGVEEGGILPVHFDPKSDAAELILMSGIFWDLARLYDRAQTPAKQREFHLYLGKYIVFSTNTPFQRNAAQAVRKHMNRRSVVHKEEFRKAYRALETSKCFVATALIDVTEPETLSTLRIWRDTVLKRRVWGRCFVYGYEKMGPYLADGSNILPHCVRKAMGQSLDFLASRIRGSGGKVGRMRR